MPSGQFLSQPKFILDCQQIPLYRGIKGFVGVIQIVCVLQAGYCCAGVPVRLEINFISIIISTCWLTAVSQTVEIYQAKNLELRSWRSEYHEGCSEPTEGHTIKWHAFISMIKQECLWKHSLWFSPAVLQILSRILLFRFGWYWLHSWFQATKHSSKELEELLETCKSFGDWPRCASDAFKQFQVPQGLGR